MKYKYPTPRAKKPCMQSALWPKILLWFRLRKWRKIFIESVAIQYKKKVYEITFKRTGNLSKKDSKNRDY